MSLEDLRKTIDLIDKDIVTLLNKRANVAVKIGCEKKKMASPVSDPAREDGVISRVHSMSDGVINSDALEDIYRKIISACSAVQE